MCGVWLCKVVHHWLSRMRQFVSGTEGLGGIRERLRLHVQVFQDHRMFFEKRRYCHWVTVKQAFAR
jgi:hypothetical protein